MDKRKHNYCIGYKGDNQVLYGKDVEGKARFIDLFTLKQVKSAIKKYPKEAKIFKITLHKPSQ